MKNLQILLVLNFHKIRPTLIIPVCFRSVLQIPEFFHVSHCTHLIHNTHFWDCFCEWLILRSGTNLTESHSNLQKIRFFSHDVTYVTSFFLNNWNELLLNKYRIIIQAENNSLHMAWKPRNLHYVWRPEKVTCCVNNWQDRRKQPC